MAPTTQKDKKNASSSPPPGQKSLTSFFGAPKSKKTGEVILPKKKLQSTIKSGLKKQGASSSSAASASTGGAVVAGTFKKQKGDETNKSTTAKENLENSDEKNDDLMDTDDDNDEAEEMNQKPAALKKSDNSTTSRKRVIDDDDDSDDDEEEEVEQENKEGSDYEEEDESEREPSDDDGSSDDDDAGKDEVDINEPPKITRRASPTKQQSSSKMATSSSSPPPKSKKQKTLTGKSAPAKKLSSSSNTTSNNNKKSSTLALQMKTNIKLRTVMSSEVDTNDTNSKLWKEDEPTLYSALCNTFQLIDEVTGRLEIQEMLTELYRKVLVMNGGGESDGKTEEEEEKKGEGKNIKSKGDAVRSDLFTLLYLTSNSVAPKHANVELGVGDSILIKAIGETSGTTSAMIKKKYDKEGDLGTVAMTAKGKQKTLVGFGRVSGPKRLSCVDVLNVFKEIANTSGSSAQKWKVDKIKSLLVRAKGCESKFIIRGLQGKLRIGVSESTVLTSLAHAIVLTKPKDVVELSDERLAEIRKLDGTDEAYPETARKLCGKKRLPLDDQLEAAVAIVKKAYSSSPSFDSILKALLTVPLQELHKHVKIAPGVPVEPMLAKPTKSVLEVLKRLNGCRFTCEYKYDGERAQVHMLSNGETKCFSRSLLNTSEKFPEVPLYVQESCKDTSVSSFVLDTEVVAWNNEKKQFVPFQVLSTRKRTEESAETAQVQVIVQAFDLMYLNGESLLDKTLSERRDLMKKNFLPVEGKFQYATSIDAQEDGDTAAIEQFLDDAVKGQCEGLMVKTLDVNAAYEPSKRSLNWLKLKKDYLEGLGDSIDLVPLGAYHGKGKRTGVYGAYLLACYDEDTEEFQSVCKIGTGFSDENLKELSASLNNHIIQEKSSQYNVSDSLACDVWFDAVQVWEIKAADLSKSSTHKGAIDKTGESGRGIGLRFPRFERIRPDKKPEEATSSDQILDMYYAQDSIIEDGGGGAMDMDGI